MSAEGKPTAWTRAASQAAAQAGVDVSARAALRSGETWYQATDAVLQALDLDGVPDLAVVFIDSQFALHYRDIIARIREETGALHLIGCSANGVIGTALEAEGESAISVMTLRLPDLRLMPLALVPRLSLDSVLASVEGAEAKVWLVLADPHTTHVEQIVAALAARAPAAAILGGLASAHNERHGTAIFVDDHVYRAGAALLGISGAVGVHTLVAQGAEPIGQPWTITACDSNLVRAVGSRPAFEVLRETLDALDEPTRERARRNLLVGLAMDEYRDAHGRGDYLVRNVLGIDRESGVVAINAVPRVGQTLQFQFRDAAAADDDLVSQLDDFKANLAPDRVVLGALLCACNGRGRSLFETPNHDAQALASVLGTVPMAGLFCNGEIGPVGGKTFLHGFTASIALLTVGAPS